MTTCIAVPAHQSQPTQFIKHLHSTALISSPPTGIDFCHSVALSCVCCLSLFLSFFLVSDSFSSFSFYLSPIWVFFLCKREKQQLRLFSFIFPVSIFYSFHFSGHLLCHWLFLSRLHALYSITKPPAIDFALWFIHNLLPVWTLHTAAPHFFSCIHPPSVQSLQHFPLIFTVPVCPDFSSPEYLISHPSGLCLCHHCQLLSLPPLLCLSLFIEIVSLTISLVLLPRSPHGDTQQM